VAHVPGRWSRPEIDIRPEAVLERPSPTAESQIPFVADFSRWLAKRQIIPREITTEHCHAICDSERDIDALDEVIWQL